jgi:hypothetical protein
VRELERGDAAGRQHRVDAAHEIVEVGHVRQHVVADEEVSGEAGALELARERFAEEGLAGRNPLLLRRRGDVGAGSMPSTGMPARAKNWSR